MLTLRSILFYPFYILIILFWVLTMLTVAPLLPVKRRTGICHLFYKLYELLLLLCCRIRVNYDYETSLQNLSARNYIIMANHESSWEAYCLTALLRPSTTILKQELLRLPLFGWALALIKPIPLQRANLIQSMKRILVDGQAKLKQGYNLLIFPQGTRSMLPQIGKFNLSAINLSLSSGYPLLLIAHNSGETLPVGKFLKFPGRINLLVAAPMDPARHSKEEFRSKAQAKMKQMLLQVHAKELVFAQ